MVTLDLEKNMSHRKKERKKEKSQRENRKELKSLA